MIIIKKEINAYDPNPPFHDIVTIYSDKREISEEEWGEEMTRLMTEFYDFEFWGFDNLTGEEIYRYSVIYNGEENDCWITVGKEE